MRTQNRSPGAFLVPVIMAGFGIVYAYKNQVVPWRDMYFVTPLTIALIVLSVAIMVRIAVRGAGERSSYLSPSVLRPVSVVVTSLILIFGAPYDFPIAAAAFLATCMAALGVRRPLVLVGVSLVTPVVVFVIFKTLGVPLKSFWLGGFVS